METVPSARMARVASYIAAPATPNCGLGCEQQGPGRQGPGGGPSRLVAQCVVAELDDVEDVEGNRLRVLVVTRPWTRTATSWKWVRPFGVTTTNSTWDDLAERCETGQLPETFGPCAPAQDHSLTREGLTCARQRYHSPIVT